MESISKMRNDCIVKNRENGDYIPCLPRRHGMDSRLFISTEQRRSLVVITTLLAFNANPRFCVAAGSPEFMKMLAYFKASYRFSPTNLEISPNSVRCHECSVTL